MHLWMSKTRRTRYIAPVLPRIDFLFTRLRPLLSLSFLSPSFHAPFLVRFSRVSVLVDLRMIGDYGPFTGRFPRNGGNGRRKQRASRNSSTISQRAFHDNSTFRVHLEFNCLPRNIEAVAGVGSPIPFEI